MNITSLTIKNIKTFKGMEGQGFNATLCNGFDKLALLIDSAQGGPLEIQWNDEDSQIAVEAYVDALPPEPMPADAEAWEATLYPNGFRKVEVEWLLNQLVADYQDDRDMIHQAKTKLLFTIPGDNGKVYHTIMHGGDLEQAKAIVAKKFPLHVLVTNRNELRASVAILASGVTPVVKPVEVTPPKPTVESCFSIPAPKKAKAAKLVVDLDALYAQVAAATNISEADLKAKYAHLGVGMQKMQLMLKIRAR